MTSPGQSPVSSASPQPQPMASAPFAQSPPAYAPQPYRQLPTRSRQSPNACLIIFLVGLALAICLVIGIAGAIILAGGLEGISQFLSIDEFLNRPVALNPSPTLSPTFTPLPIGPHEDSTGGSGGGTTDPNIQPTSSSGLPSSSGKQFVNDHSLFDDFSSNALGWSEEILQTSLRGFEAESYFIHNNLRRGLSSLGDRGSRETPF